MAVAASASCAHCGHQAKSPLVAQGGEIFCGQGCQMVYSCLKEGRLTHFYDILKSRKEAPRGGQLIEGMDFLQDAEFVKAFGQGEHKRLFFFYIEGISCMACTWVFKNVDHISDDIVASRFDLRNNVLAVEVASVQVLLKVAQFVNGLGYKMVPLKNIDDAKSKYQDQKRSELKRIGITAALLMNIMIYSVAIYGGADDSLHLKSVFTHIMAALYVPIVFYSAIPFYKNLLGALRTRSPNIDVPIGLSIILGSVLSYYHYMRGEDTFYFDSVAMFVLLILSTRYLLAWIYRREVSAKLFDGVYGQQQVHKRMGETFLPKHISQITVGDCVRVEKSGIVPLDGSIVAGNAYFNESLISGESLPVLRRQGETVHSGSKNLGEALEIKVSASGRQNSFANYLSALDFDTGNLDNYAKFGGTYSACLGIGLLIVCAALLWIGPLPVALEKVLSLMIICCPCALGIGIPLATLLKLKSLAAKGILVRDKSIFEKFSRVKTLCFDKTGTLTTGEYQVEQIKGDGNALSLLVALEERSEHPIAKFLVRHFASFKDGNLVVEQFKEIPGQGVEGNVGGRQCRIFSDNSGDIIMEIEERQALRLALRESHAQRSIDLLEMFNKTFDIEIISGDSKQRVDEFCKKISGKGGRVSSLHSLKPQEKCAHLCGSRNAFYVGDGLNDVLAMREADISVSLNASKLVDDVCSVIFLGGGLEKLSRLFDGIKHLHRVIGGNIALSITYNIIGLGLVLGGMVGPLVAAILMPISSLIVVLSTFFRTQERLAWQR